MSLEIVEVSREHWGILSRIADGVTPPKESSVAVLAVEGNRPVGRILLVQPAHVEGVWIEPSLRRGPVLARLVERIENEAKKRGMSSVFAYAMNSDMEAYIDRLGYLKQPWTVWRKQLCP